MAGRLRRAVWVGGLTLIGAGAALHVFSKPESNLEVRIGEITIQSDVADNVAERARGLSGRASMGRDEGMLFMFTESDYHRFWMKDMRFPIDIIWIDMKKRIIGIEQNVPPLVGKTNPVFYIPPGPIKYALEVNAGFSQQNKILIGDTVDF